MNPVTEQIELAEPHLAGWLASLGLGVEYVRAAGNRLYYLDADGTEVEVLDLVGGYGSTILGHNNPELVEYAKSLLDAGTPIHAQFSRHPYANELAWQVNAIIRREFDTSEPYSAIFANSGAESIEIALKHAELDRVMRLAEVSAQIERNLVEIQASLGSAADDLVAEVRAANAERVLTAPVFLAPEGSFHGKLVGSVQLTHNPGYRTPFRALAAQCRFVPQDDAEALTKIVAEERKTLLDLEVVDGAARIVERDLPVIAAFVLEPIQGEAGIRELDRAFAARVRAVADELGCPVVIDEVQSGMGRSGAFFASSHLGLQGDYFTLAKSLGGGIAKAGLTLVRSSRYRTDFELVHSSTFAKDSFSTLIASKTVELLEAADGEAYRLAEHRGTQLRAMLEKLRGEFPAVIADVRGRGLMLGLEFADLSGSPDDTIREQAESGLVGYLFSGYLLRAHAVRMFPTASATSTLRLEPSVYLDDADIARLETALRGLIAVLQAHDGKTLLGI